MPIEKKYYFDKKVFFDLVKKYKKGNLSSASNKLSKSVKPYSGKWDTLKDLPEKYKKEGIKSLKNKETGAVIVNGGMATRFGGVVKGTVKAYNNMSFLEIKIKQIKKLADSFNTDIPVFIMNSFATDEATVKHFEKNKYFGYKKNIYFFNQFVFKRINKQGNYFTGVKDKAKQFYGPGHGDFSFALKKSGMLNKFLKRGGKYLYYSNVDNLGASIEPSIIGYHKLKKNEMTVEIARKTKNDKGGAPALTGGKLTLVEGFMFPDDFKQENIKVFNTATYVFTAESLYKVKKLRYYYVEKTAAGKKAVQFERLAGDMSALLKCGYIVVERNKRFIPVKTPDDLTSQKNKIKSAAEGLK